MKDLFPTTCGKPFRVFALFLFLFAGFWTNTLQAQWTLVHEHPQVNIYEQVVKMDDMKNDMMYEYIIFKYENKTSNALSLSWYFEIHIDGVCSNCDGVDDEYTANLELGPNETYEGAAGNMVDKDNRRVLIKKVLNHPSVDITKYTFKNLIITNQ